MKLRESKSLLWVGFAVYLLISVICGFSRGFTSAGVVLNQPAENLYITDANLYRAIVFIDDWMLIIAVFFIRWLDNHPGKDSKKELVADALFMVSGYLLGRSIFAATFVLRFLDLLGTGGTVAILIHEMVKEAVLILPCLMLFVVSSRALIKLANEKPQAKP